MQNSLRNIPLCAQYAGLLRRDRDQRGAPVAATVPDRLHRSAVRERRAARRRQDHGMLARGRVERQRATTSTCTTEIRYFYTGGGRQRRGDRQGRVRSSRSAFDCAGTPDPTHPFTPDILGDGGRGLDEGQRRQLPRRLGHARRCQPGAGRRVQRGTERRRGRAVEPPPRRLQPDHLGGGGLTAGASQATNVQQAATRLDGANELLDGYVSLGLPQALASDDALQGLVSGTNSDTFAPASGGLAGTARAGNVPGAGPQPVPGRDQRRSDQQRPTGHGSGDPGGVARRSAGLAARGCDQRAHRVERCAGGGAERPRPAECRARGAADDERGVRRGEPVHRADARPARRDRAGAERQRDRRAGDDRVDAARPRRPRRRRR